MSLSKGENHLSFVHLCELTNFLDKQTHIKTFEQHFKAEHHCTMHEILNK